MRLVFSLIFISLTLLAEELKIKGNIDIEYKKQDFSSISIKDITSKSINAQIEFTKYYDELKLFTDIEALKDKDDNQRKYIKINEAYIKYEAENYDLLIGKDIRFWGSLELSNLTDIFNEKNTINDSYDKDKKLGTKNITYTRYFENEDELSVILMDDNPYSKYLKYSGSRDDIANRDFSYILSTNQDDNRFLTYHTAIVDDTIYKMEFAYINSKITNNYAELGIGLEHTLYGFRDKKDLGIIVEYYKSDNETLNFQDDIFTGVRISFNDTDDSDIVAGIITDLDTQQKRYSFEYNTRFKDNFKLQVTYLKNNTFNIVGLSMGYYF